jgi:peptidoglycan/LPS O-acetylase OafA/YrhL
VSKECAASAELRPLDSNVALVPVPIDHAALEPGAYPGRGSGRIASLDGLRAVSIVLVIVDHFSEHLAKPTALGAFGVQIFFVISGFLITTLLLQEEQRTGKISLQAFYRRRIFRIVPAAYVFILAIALVEPVSRSYLPYTLTFTSSYLHRIQLVIGHLWSLSVEEQFYLLWPCAMVLGFRYRGTLAAIGILGAALFRVWSLHYASDPGLPQHLHFWFPGVMDSLSAGCLLAIYQPIVRKACRWAAASSIVALGLPLLTWLAAWWLWRDTWVAPMHHTYSAAFWGLIPILIEKPFLQFKRASALGLQHVIRKGYMHGAR